MNAEEMFLQHIGTIERICAFVCRRNHVYDADAVAEFKQEVMLRLVDDDYSIIRKFEGRSAFPTYLTTVIARLHNQIRDEQWGKWRPSAEAKRLGEKAITLEKLTTRDGLTFHEAVQVLTTPSGSLYTVAELEAIYMRLPTRNPRPMVISVEDTPESAADTDAAERIEAREREQTARTTVAIVDRVMGTFGAEDQLILRMRYWEARKVPDIAGRLQIEQKKIYKRLDKLCALIRSALEKAGIGRGDIDRLVSGGDQDLRFDLLGTPGKPLRQSLSPWRRRGRR